MENNEELDKDVIEGESVNKRGTFNQNNDSHIDEKMKSFIIVIQTVVIIVLVVALKVNIDTHQLTNYERTIDYNKIEAILEKHMSEQVEATDVDYERIEDLMKENQADVEKDFGDKFEEMTSYFGEKFKDFIGTVNDKLQDNKKAE